MGEAVFRRYDLAGAVSAPESTMVDREVGRGQPEEAAEAVDAARAMHRAVVREGAMSGEDQGVVRRAHFLEALDKVMKDHRNVLAALAK